MTESEDKAKIAQLESEIATLKAGLKAVELRTQPPPKVPVAAPLQGIGATEKLAIDRMTVPQHVLDDMARAVGDGVIGQITREDRKR
jgi:hypothetical protein